MADDDLAALAASAKRAAILAVISVGVALVVLIIDNGIKKHVVAKAAEARSILDEFKKAANSYGAEAAGEAGDGPGDRVDGGNGVVDDAAAGKVLGAAAGGVVRAPRGRAPGVAGRAAGDGRGTAGS